MTATEPCARCGHDSDFEIAALWLCLDCYHVAGSTCAGIGRVPNTASASSVTPNSVTASSGPDQIVGWPVDGEPIC
jgi:hypothetical protein